MKEFYGTPKSDVLLNEKLVRSEILYKISSGVFYIVLAFILFQAAFEAVATVSTINQFNEPWDSRLGRYAFKITLLKLFIAGSSIILIKKGWLSPCVFVACLSLSVVLFYATGGRYIAVHYQYFFLSVLLLLYFIKLYFGRSH